MAKYYYDQGAARVLRDISRQEKQKNRIIKTDSIQCGYCGYVNHAGDPCLKNGVCRQCGRSLCPLLPAEWPVLA